MKIHHKFTRRFTQSVIFVLIFGIVFYIQSTTLAQATALPITCTNLSTSAPSGSTNYVFTVKSADASSNITGYTFDFGDRQSYTFSFGPNTPNQNRLQASVTHTYAGFGVYNASVRVDAKANGRTMSVTSASCHSTIVLGPTMTVLVDTGAGNVPELFVLASLAGIAAYQLRLRYRRAAR